MIQSEIAKHPCRSCITIFIICMITRCFEYFIIRTDETVVAENFIHKVFGIILLFFLLRALQWTWHSIGFKKENFLKYLGLGFLLGFICFSLSYIVEMTVLFLNEKNPQLQIYTSGFSISGEPIMQTGIGFILLCIVFNIVNVWMEEGIFRGLYLNILKSRYTFKSGNVIAAFLFGIWHWAMPMRSFIDGDSSLPNLLIMGIGYVILAGIMSIKWGMLYKMSGSLWIGVGDHFFNNAIASNLLHVVSDTGTDEWQIIRILLAQLISFVFVIILYNRKLRTTE